MEWVASTLHTTSERGVSRITTVDAHTSAASSRLNWRPCLFKWTRPFRRKTKSGFCACAIIFQLASTWFELLPLHEWGFLWVFYACSGEGTFRCCEAVACVISGKSRPVDQFAECLFSQSLSLPPSKWQDVTSK